MSKLSDRTILVTGAGAGIGRAVSKAYALEGATLILLDKQLKAIETLYDEITAAGAPEPALYPMDLLGAKQQDYLDLASTLHENFGSLHGLVHNAAYLGFLSRVDDFDAEIWFRTLQVNLNAPFLMTQACLHLLRAAGDASVLFTSDTVGRQGRAYWGAYAASKSGLENLMEVLADELRDSTRIRVNSIDPGPTRTGFRAQAFPAEDKGKLQPPESVVPLYVWAMDPASSAPSGKALSMSDQP